MWNSPAAIARAGSPGPEVHRRDLPGGLVVADGGGVAVSEAPGRAVAPAADRAVVEDRAGVRGARRDRPGRAPGPEIDGGRGGRREDVVLVAVPQAAVLAEAPAAHGSVVQDRAGVEVPGHDGPGVAPGAEVDGPGGGRREHVAVVAVAQAPRHALAPAAHGAVGEDRAGVLLAGVDVAALGRTDARRGLLSRGDGDEGAEEADQDDPEHGQPHPPDEGLGHLESSYHSGTGHVTIHGKASRIGLNRTAGRHPTHYNRRPCRSRS